MSAHERVVAWFGNELIQMCSSARHMARLRDKLVFVVLVGGVRLRFLEFAGRRPVVSRCVLTTLKNIAALCTNCAESIMGTLDIYFTPALPFTVIC